MYDAWAAYDAVAWGTRLGETLRRPRAERTESNQAKAISYAAYRALLDLFPAVPQLFVDAMTQVGYDPADSSIDLATPSGVGNLATQVLLSFRHGDGSNQLSDLHPGAYSDYTGYRPVNTPDQIHDPNRWQPLRVADGHGGFVEQTFIAPHWGLVTPFALQSPHQFQPDDNHVQRHPAKGYERQAKAVLEYSANLSDRDKVIAEYWADGPSSELPPGHWCLFAQYVSARDRHTLDADIKLFFALTNAIFDASIVCWGVKRHFDYVRPVTAIHYLFRGQQVKAWAGPGLGTQTIRGEDWQPYQAATVVTPPFAEYISGHSTFSAAGAEILRRFTDGDHFGASYTQPAGSSRVEPGLVPAEDLTLRWDTFSEAADEAGISRRYGGIHFEDGDLDGRRRGRRLAVQAWNLAQDYIHGRL
ncbi:vanadium-dependent haloperoxidase [Nodosilinea sp. LEGE 07298]|nr:vanadium-dependent haloperoxidase [Nodosilinea sp. LEGE 07298]